MQIEYGINTNIAQQQTGINGTGTSAPRNKPIHPAQADTISLSPEALAKLEESGPGPKVEGSPFGLSPEQEQRANALFGELDSIFSSDEKLTADQEKRVGEIFQDLDSLLPVEEEFALTADEEKRVDKLFSQLDELHANGPLSPDQEKMAGAIEKELDSIFMAVEQREGGSENLTVAMQGVANDGSEGPETLKETAAASSSGKSTEDVTIERLKEQIKRLKEEIEALEKGDLPEKEKNNQIQAKQAQLMEMNDQLLKAEQEKLKASGQAIGGGTRANGFGNSVSSF